MTKFIKRGRVNPGMLQDQPSHKPFWAQWVRIGARSGQALHACDGGRIGGGGGGEKPTADGVLGGYLTHRGVDCEERAIVSTSPNCPIIRWSVQFVILSS